MDLDTFCSYVAKNSLRICILKRQEAEPRASRESERYSVVIVVQYSDARSGDGKEDGTTATTKSTFGLRESWRRALIGLLSC